MTRKMIAIDPKNDKFHFTLGALFDETKQKEAGIDEMKKAIELNPRTRRRSTISAIPMRNRVKNLDEAERLIKRALVVEPEDGFYVDSLGWVYYQKGEYKKAVTELERAVTITNNDPTITEHLGDAYRKIGKLKEASHEYDDALKKAEESDQLLRLKDKLQGVRNALGSGGAASAGH